MKRFLIVVVVIVLICVVVTALVSKKNVAEPKLYLGTMVFGETNKIVLDDQFRMIILNISYDKDQMKCKTWSSTNMHGQGITNTYYRGVTNTVGEFDFVVRQFTYRSYGNGLMPAVTIDFYREPLMSQIKQ